MPSATLIFHRKHMYEDGAIAEMKLWRVPSSVRGSKHSFKYSLYYGHRGDRLIGYDNEAGKGDHRHYASRQELYPFTTPERLITDFISDVLALRDAVTKGDRTP